VICGIIKVNIKVVGDSEFMKKERKELKSARKIENGFSRGPTVRCLFHKYVGLILRWSD